MPSNPSDEVVQRIKNLTLSPEIHTRLEEIRKSLLETYYKYSGIENQKLLEVKPNFDQTSNEKVYEGKTNSFIILGADRYGGAESGEGGAGNTSAAAIDIVVGLMGERPIDNVNGSPAKASKNFMIDSARVYVSQASNIDAQEYFNIPKFSYTIDNKSFPEQDCEGKSSVGIISDHTRIYGRESVKIVTSHIGVSACTTDIEPSGVDILAGCDVKDPLHIPQPMVKGENLINCLKALILLIEKVQTTTTLFFEKQTEINQLLLKHKHQSGYPGSPTDEMLENTIPKKIIETQRTVLPEIIKNNSEFGSVLKDYFSPRSEKYINSLFNRVN